MTDLTKECPNCHSNNICYIETGTATYTKSFNMRKNNHDMISLNNLEKEESYYECDNCPTWWELHEDGSLVHHVKTPNGDLMRT